MTARARQSHWHSSRPARAAWLLLACCWLAPALAQLHEVRVGVYQNEPKIFAGPAGQASGILGDLLQTMAKREGWRLTPVPCDWQACLAAVQEGQIDLMPDVAYTEQRAQQFDFHRVPSLHSWSQLYQRGGTQIKSMLDLQGKRVAVLEGSVQHDYLSQLLLGFGLQAEVVPVKSLRAGFELVVSNRFFGDAQAPRYALTASAIMFQPAQLFYATGKGRNADLLASIDQHLTELGRY